MRRDFQRPADFGHLGLGDRLHDRKFIDCATATSAGFPHPAQGRREGSGGLAPNGDNSGAKAESGDTRDTRDTREGTRKGG